MLRLMILALLALVPSTNAHAITITYALTGTIQSINDPQGLFSGVSVNDPFSGFLEYQTAVPADGTDLAVGGIAYTQVLAIVSVTAGGITYTNPVAGARITVTNCPATDCGGTADLKFFRTLGQGSPQPSVNFRDTTATALSNEVLGPITLSAWNDVTMGVDLDPTTQLSGAVDTLTLVPEPGTGSLLLLGLLGLATKRRTDALRPR
jgi:hypothetical protein